MRIGEWEHIGRSRGLVARELGELGAIELAAHVTIHADGERQRVMIATDIGLLDYNFGPTSPGTSTYDLRGTMHRWQSIRGMRLQSDAQWDDNAKTARSVWRLIAEEPRIELAAESSETDRHDVTALLDFARACFSCMNKST